MRRGAAAMLRAEKRRRHASRPRYATAAARLRVYAACCSGAAAEPEPNNRAKPPYARTINQKRHQPRRTAQAPRATTALSLRSTERMKHVCRMAAPVLGSANEGQRAENERRRREERVTCNGAQNGANDPQQKRSSAVRGACMALRVAPQSDVRPTSEPAAYAPPPPPKSVTAR